MGITIHWLCEKCVMHMTCENGKYGGYVEMGTTRRGMRNGKYEGLAGNGKYEG